MKNWQLPAARTPRLRHPDKTGQNSVTASDYRPEVRSLNLGAFRVVRILVTTAPQPAVTGQSPGNPVRRSGVHFIVDRAHGLVVRQAVVSKLPVP